MKLEAFPQNLNTENSDITQQKEDQFKKEVEKLEQYADLKGMGIDEGIKESVAVFNALGFNTSQSCEGHVGERGIPAPWVEIEASNKPEERFLGENRIYTKIAEKYDISVEDVERAYHEEAYKEAVREISNQEETGEYKEWEEENEKLKDRMKKLLGEFYENREVNSSSKIEIENQVGGFRIHNGGDDYSPIIDSEKELIEKEKEELLRRLKKYQKEMSEFTEFLKGKFNNN